MEPTTRVGSLKLNIYEITLMDLARSKFAEVFATDETEARAIAEREFPNWHIAKIMNLTE